jgi:uncharacterized membrane protein YoaK (UPF0700 family)
MSPGAERTASRQLRKPRRVRDAAAVALTVTSGATDAVGFLALGGRDVSHHLLLLVGLVGGATIASLLALGAPVPAPLTQLLPLALVLGIAGWQGRAGRRTETGARADETSHTTRMDA